MEHIFTIFNLNSIFVSYKYTNIKYLNMTTKSYYFKTHQIIPGVFTYWSTVKSTQIYH